MACFGNIDRRSKKGCFERSSPALQQILLQLFRAERPMEIDHHLYEFGSVEYHIESSVSDGHNVYLSISTPILASRTLESNGLCSYTIQKVKDICPTVVEVTNPPRDGYQLTLLLNISNIPQGKDGMKIIKEIAAIESVILSSQLKELLHSFSSEDGLQQGTYNYKPIKFLYHPREPIFLIRLPHKLTVVFPMRFKESSDLIIATSFFQELMEIGSSEALAKAPACTWSPIPPPELRGEPIQDLSTNGGFVSFDILSRHVDGKRLDKTLWNLLNFYAYVKSHITSTKGFIQRKMRKRLDDLEKMLHQPNLHEAEHKQKVQGCGWVLKPVRLPRLRKVRKRYSDLNRKINRIRIQGFSELNRKIKRIHQRIKTRHHRWFSIPKFTSSKGYSRLD